MIYAGIDEAGYGPMLGPFDVGLAAFRLPGEVTDPPPDLFELLAAAVSTSSRGADGRVVVADSKALYSPSGGLGRLEEALGAFLAAAGRTMSPELPAFLEEMGGACAGELSSYDWYDCSPRAPFLAPLPRDADAERIAECGDALRSAMEAAGVELACLAVRITDVAEWNEAIARTKNKATAAFRRVREHLLRLWDDHGDEGVIVQVDKQGGRNLYLSPLQEVFPLFSIETIAEGKDDSSYRVQQGARHMTIHFAPRSEDRHLPVALASIAAKYVRELLMERLNAWFTAHDPQLHPTAGYPQDARRWLQETADLRADLGIEDHRLIRDR